MGLRRTYMTVMGELVPLENRLQMMLPRTSVEHKKARSQSELHEVNEIFRLHRV